MHYGARFYSLRLGRFVSADSIVPNPGASIDLNRYAYVYGNPVNHTDPSGHFIETPLDLLDLGIDIASCLGGDAWSCAVLPVDVAALAIPGVLATYGSQYYDDMCRGALYYDDAYQGAVWLGDVDETIIFYHGTTGKHISSFEQEGFLSIGGGDFGRGFYVTRRESEGIHWAESKANIRRQAPYVVTVEIRKSEFDELVAKIDKPKNFWTDPFELEMYLYQRGHPEIPYDYIYGEVLLKPDFEQFTFKSRRAFDLLNSSPRSIYKVSPQGELELIKRIVP